MSQKRSASADSQEGTEVKRLKGQDEGKVRVYLSTITVVPNSAQWFVHGCLKLRCRPHLQAVFCSWFAKCCFDPPVF